MGECAKRTAEVALAQIAGALMELTAYTRGVQSDLERVFGFRPALRHLILLIKLLIKDGD